jgi:radical SAM superfamily enzyme YgiQ (UPF0313 family)
MVKVAEPAEEDGPRNFPLGLMALAAWVRKNDPGFDFSIVDQTVGPMMTAGAIAERVVEQGIGVVGLCVYSCEAAEAERIARAVKAMSPGTVVVAGGPHPSMDPEGSLAEPAIDFGVRGEGEIPFAGFLQALVNGQDPGRVPGVLARRNGRVSEIEPGAVVQDLDQLPRPAFDLVDVRVYWRYSGVSFLGPRPYLPLFTSRGCPWQCTYCHKLFGDGVRARSPEAVLLDMEALGRQYGVLEFEILDDCFNFGEARALAILNQVQSRIPGGRLAFPNGLRTDRMSPAFIEAMARAGTIYISFAIESASPRIQKLIRKNLDLDAARASIDQACRLGIFCYGFFMLGFPTESAEELRRTVAFACSTRLHVASFFLVTPHKGTELWNSLGGPERAMISAVDAAHRRYSGTRLWNLSGAPDRVFRKIWRSAFVRFYLDPVRVSRTVFTHPRPITLLSIGFRKLARALLNTTFNRLAKHPPRT